MELASTATIERSAARSRLAEFAPRLLPWAGYFAVTLFFLRDILPVMLDHLPGRTDSWQNVWNVWWMRYALLDLHTNPFYSDYIYYPTGSSLLFHTYAPLNGVLALPFTVSLGPLVTVNLLIFSSFVFTGMAAYALARGIGISAFGSWVAGAIYSFCNPARWQYFGGGQADHLSMYWMPLYILCLVKATSHENVDKPLTRANLPWKWILGAGVFLTFNGLTDWQFVVYLAVFTGLYALYLLLRERTAALRLRALLNLVLAGAAGVVIMSPVLVPTISEALDSIYAVRPIWQTIYHSYDVASYFMPNPVNPVWGAWAAGQNILDTSQNNIPGILNAGYLPLALAAIGAVFCWRKVWQWAALALIFAVFSLGPLLHINGTEQFGPDRVQIPMPYDLLLKLPFVNISRDPGRFSLITYLCIGLLAGFGWMVLRKRIAQPRTPLYYALAGVVALGILGEFAPVTYPISTQPVSDFVHRLAADPADYALVEVPVADKFYAEYTEALMPIHHKRILGGQTARKPCYCFAMETPVVRWFWDLALPRDGDIVANPEPSTYAPAILSHFNLRYIILYKWILKPEDYAKAQSVVDAVMPGAQPVADDAAITAYAVPLTSTTKLMPISILDDWGNLEQSPYGPVRWVSDQGATIKVVNATDAPRPVHMQVQAQSFAQPRTMQLLLNGKQTITATVSPQLQLYTFDLTLQPGSNEVFFSSPEPAIVPSEVDPASKDTRKLTFAVLKIAFTD